jgi:hypothetical protein
MVRIEDAEESLSELTQLLAGYGAPTGGLCNRRKEDKNRKWRGESQ